MRPFPSRSSWKRVVLGFALLSGPAAISSSRSAIAEATPPADASGEADDGGAADRRDDRFPQTVRVGDLIGRAVLRPDEDRGIVGRIRSIVRLGDGTLAFVMERGGWFGFGRQTVSLPLDQLALLGQDTALPDFEPEAASTYPNFVEGSAIVLSPDAIVRIGLAKPYH